MKIKFIPAKTHPTKEGLYFWRSSSGEISLIRVREYKGFTGNWIGISDFAGRNVQAFDVGQFSDKVEFE